MHPTCKIPFRRRAHCLYVYDGEQHVGVHRLAGPKEDNQIDKHA
jgi:hypothetical protein